MNRHVLYPLRRLHGALHDWKSQYDLKRHFQKAFREKQKANPKTVYLVLTPEHGNLGDHAIAQAESELLKSIGVDYVEITGKQLAQMWQYRVQNAMNGHPILVNGGGNLGTLWPDVENLQRDLMQKNPKSPIFILPNTIFYEDTPWGKEEFEKSVLIYNAHKNLHLYAREKTSYTIMQKAYRNVKLIPDMVLSLNESGRANARSGCLLCLRGDCEKTRTTEQEMLLRQQIDGIFGANVSELDMIAEHEIQPAQRHEALQKQLDAFARAELVVTDRLHGMIFCAITGTPCVVINSKSPKVRGCYAWIQDLDYIKFADDVSQVAALYRSISAGEHRYDNTFLQPYYDELKQDILSIWNGRA